LLALPRELSAATSARPANLKRRRRVRGRLCDRSHQDPRFVFARHVWRTDNALATLSLITAGLGWGWLPRNFVRPHVAAGALVKIPFGNLSNGFDLWVDVVWSRERPLGLGAQRFVALIARKKD
jgi:DNA-binding transcriptional LysR family regulator